MVHFSLWRSWLFRAVTLLLCFTLAPPAGVVQEVQGYQLSVVCVPPFQPDGAIAGQVTAADTGQPLRSVPVRGYAGAAMARSTSTDSNGFYVLRNLRPSDYTVKFGNRSPYGSEWYDNQISANTAVAVAVTSGLTTTGINAALDLGAVISGVVTAADTGLPLDDVSVQIYDAAGDRVGSDLTNAQGQYEVDGLMTGSYKVLFTPRETGKANAYLAEWYQDKPDATAGDLVAVSAPNLTAGINAALVRGGQISGTVTTQDTGSGLEYISVNVYASSGEQVLSTTTDAAGRYTTPALPAGSYQVLFEPIKTGDAAYYITEWYNDQPARTDATVVNVVGATVVPDIDGSLARGGVIRGTVTAAATSAPLYETNIHVYNSTGDQVVASALTDATGVYTVTGLASGVYKVHFSTSRFGATRDYLSQWYNNQAGADTAEPITITAPNLADGIHAALEKGGRIRGRVTAEVSGAALDDVTVTVYDAVSGYVGSVPTDAAGFYTMTQLATGSYLVEFEPYYLGVSGSYLAEWYDNKPERAAADAVQVIAPNDKTAVDAELAGGSHICGKVTAADTGQGLEDIVVDFYDTNGREQATAFTDATGAYVSPALPPGDYKIEFHPLRSSAAYAYIPEWHSDKANHESADVVTVTAPGADLAVDAVLNRGGQISGTVTAADTGQGLDDVVVSFYNLAGDRIDSASADASGSYLSPGLPSGAYKVRFGAIGDAASYRTEWYDDQPAFESADPVTVTAPDITGAIDAVLARGDGSSSENLLFLPVIQK